MTADEPKTPRSKPKHDITGRDRLVKNLAGRYLGQIVVIISGFIIPRLISDNLGAVTLGIWDFGWSVVSYFRYMSLGLAAGLNRFVALYNARGDTENLQRVVSSTLFLQAMVAAAIAVASVLVSTVMPRIFGGIPPEQVEQSRLVILYLGFTLSLKTLFWPSRGILTGFHLVTVTAAVTAAGDIAVLVGMIVVLGAGGGLAELGLVVLFSSLAMELLRLYCAKRAYRHRILNWSAVNRTTMKEMVVFGLKNSLSAMPGVVVLQTTAVCLASAAGPAALAVYARPLALFMHVDRLILHYAALLTPVAGSLQGLDRDHELKEFLLSSLKSAFALTIPAIFLLSGYGDVIVGAWMGQDYVVPWLAPILGAAVLFPFSHAAALRILVGVNAHGRVALKTLTVTVIVLSVACTVAYSYGWSPQTAAMVVAVSLVCGPGLVVITAACKRFHISFSEYFTIALMRPLLCNVLLAGIIVASRLLTEDMNILEAMAWGGTGGAVVVLLYWKFLLDSDQRLRLLRAVGLRKKPARKAEE